MLDYYGKHTEPSAKSKKRVSRLSLKKKEINVEERNGDTLKNWRI